VRAKGLPTLIGAGDVSQAGDELSLSQPVGGLDRDLSADGRVRLVFADTVSEPIPDGSGPEDDERALGRHVRGNQVDEASQVLEPIGFASVLCPSATVPHSRVVAHVPRRPMVCRNV
jgi:hypothetical protein